MSNLEKLKNQAPASGSVPFVDSCFWFHWFSGTRKDKREAERLLHPKHEAELQPAINLQIAKAYLAASDPNVAKRTWRDVFAAIIDTKLGETKARWLRASKEVAFSSIHDLVVIETHAEHLLTVLKEGAVSTNVHLRKLHNFCLDMNWLPWPIIPKKQWPPVRFGEKRAITAEEYHNIIERERNPEHRALYQLCWLLGGSQMLRFMVAVIKPPSAAFRFEGTRKRTTVTCFKVHSIDQLCSTR